MRQHPVNDTYLTAREMELLRLVTAGYQNKEIARLMCISIKTVEKHRQMVLRKLRVDCAIAMLRVALRAGLISYCEWLNDSVGENLVRTDSVSGQQIKLPSPRPARAE